MTSGLPALGDDYIDAERHRSPGLLSASDRVKNYRTGVVRSLNVASGVSPGQRDDAQPRLERFVEMTVLIPSQDEVAAERTPCQSCCFPHRARDIADPRQRNHPKRARLRDRRGELRHGGNADRRLDDRVCDSEQLGHRRTHKATLVRPPSHSNSVVPRQGSTPLLGSLEIAA